MVSKHGPAPFYGFPRESRASNIALLAAVAALVACSARDGSDGGGGSSPQGGVPGSGGSAPLSAGTGGVGLPVGGQGTAGEAAGQASVGGSGGTGGSPSSNGGSLPTAGGSMGGDQQASGGAAASSGTAGGAAATGGTAGGAAATGGTAGVGGSSALSGPCDIYQTGNTPCVAAHSTVRAVYAKYSGSLYQVRRASDKTVKDIAVLSPGGYANSAEQDAFCSGTTCTISVIYDQSPKGNHLTVTPPGGWLTNGGTEAKAADAKITVAGHAVYGVYTTGSFDATVGGVGYRNNKAKGTATGDQPEAIYAVVGGKHFNQYCCFDYGNAETNNMDDGSATMEALYFGNSTQWGKGSGTGPWVMADLENGLFAGQSFAAPATNTSLVADYVTGMVKGKPGTFTLKGSNAQSGSLKTLYDGSYPSGYSPMKKQGAIILGVGGDNSHTGEGTFFEGCMTAGYPSDATDDAVQANVVAAGYGR